MPDKAIVHIGLAKTGTTAIQTFLASARGRLAKSDVLFPLSGTINRRGGHHCLAWALGGNERLAGVCRGDPVNALNAELDQAKEREILISSEDLSGISYNASAIKKLVSILGTRNLQTIVYVREQVEWFNSFYVENLKELTETRPIAEFVLALRREPRYHYENWMELWRQLSATLSVRPYMRTQLISEDVVADFVHTAGLQRILQNAPIRRDRESNKTLSAPRVAALLYVARLLAQSGITPEKIGAERWTHHKRKLLPLVFNNGAFDGAPYWGFGKALAAEIRDEYLVSNRRFLKDHGLEPHLFERGEERPLERARLSHLDAESVRSLTTYVAEMEAEVE